MRDERLTLIGQNPVDLPSISALLQDATVRTADAGWDRRSRRFVLLANRYRWEASVSSRVRSAFRIESVVAVQRQNWPADAVLNLLGVTIDDDWLALTFAAGTALRVQVEVIEVVLEDLAAPWPTERIPNHPA